MEHGARVERRGTFAPISDITRTGSVTFHIGYPSYEWNLPCMHPIVFPFICTACACACVCEGETERGRKGERRREREAGVWGGRGEEKKSVKKRC